MNKEIAFWIWLYDRQLSHPADDPYDESAAECHIIREKYADFFGLNELVNSHHIDGDDG